jgi:hypothetical protein
MLFNNINLEAGMLITIESSTGCTVSALIQTIQGKNRQPLLIAMYEGGGYDPLEDIIQDEADNIIEVYGFSSLFSYAASYNISHRDLLWSVNDTDSDDGNDDCNNDCNVAHINKDVEITYYVTFGYSLNEAFNNIVSGIMGVSFTEKPALVDLVYYLKEKFPYGFNHTVTSYYLHDSKEDYDAFYDMIPKKLLRSST